MSGKSIGTPGVELIAAERLRQVNEEGWDAEHDKQWSGGELIGAAVSYALQALLEFDTIEVVVSEIARYWPWSARFMPKGRKYDLIRAGALIAAELDRMAQDE